MQYKLFSTHEHWLPQAPKILKGITVQAADGSTPSLIEQLELQGVLTQSIVVPDDMGAVGGELTFLSYMQLDEGNYSKIMSNDALVNKLQDWKLVRDDLKRASIKSLTEQVARMTVEAEGVVVTHKEDYRDRIHKELIGISSTTHGYIIWLKQTNNKITSIWQLTPSALNPVVVNPKLLDQLTNAQIDLDVEENIDEIEFDESMSENRRARLAYATRNLSTSSGKRYISGSKQIATTAKFILNHLALGSFHQLPKGEDFSYIHTALTTEDLSFYNARNTDMKVIELCVQAYENAPP
jgi:hypothetical protein